MGLRAAARRPAGAGLGVPRHPDRRRRGARGGAAVPADGRGHRVLAAERRAGDGPAPPARRGRRRRPRRAAAAVRRRAPSTWSPAAIPATIWWDEIARVLRPGGTYFAQHVGPASAFELIEFFLGPQPGGAAAAGTPTTRPPPRGGGTRHRRPADRAAPDRDPRRRGRRLPAAQGDLVGAGLHRRAVPGPAPRAARPHPGRRPVRRPLHPPPDRGPAALSARGSVVQRRAQRASARSPAPRGRGGRGCPRNAAVARQRPPSARVQRTVATPLWLTRGPLRELPTRERIELLEDDGRGTFDDWARVSTESVAGWPGRERQSRRRRRAGDSW